MRGMRHDALEPGAIQPLELVRCNRFLDTQYLGSRKRNQVGIAVHKADPPAVRDDLNNIAREQHAFPAGSLFPMQDRAAGKMAAPPDQGDSIRERIGFPRPEPDTPPWPPHPFSLWLVSVDWRV